MKWIVWTLAVIFFFYEYILRVFPAVMVPELMGDFSLSAHDFGTAMAFYFFAYAPLQLPIGILTDRYGARRILTYSAVLCAIGAIAFSLVHHIWSLKMGRLLMGAGSAAGFVGMIYVASHWFPAKRLALLVGLGNSIGMIGGVLGEGPLAYAVHGPGWRPTVFVLGIFGILLALVLYIIVRNDPKGTLKHSLPDISHAFDHFKTVCKSRQIWINAASGFFLFATINGFGVLWGVPFLQTTYDLSKDIAGFATSMTLIGVIVGGPLIGHYSDVLGRRKLPIILSSIFGFIAIFPVIYLTKMPIFLLFIFLFLVGLFSGGQLLNFSFAIDTMPRFAKGSATAVTNFIVMAGGAIVQPLIGFLLDVFSDGKSYDLGDFTFAMSFFPLSFIVAAILALFLNEKREETLLTEL